MVETSLTVNSPESPRRTVDLPCALDTRHVGNVTRRLPRGQGVRFGRGRSESAPGRSPRLRTDHGAEVIGRRTVRPRPEHGARERRGRVEAVHSPPRRGPRQFRLKSKFWTWKRALGEAGSAVHGRRNGVAASVVEGPPHGVPAERLTDAFTFGSGGRVDTRTSSLSLAGRAAMGGVASTECRVACWMHPAPRAPLHSGRAEAQSAREALPGAGTGSTASESRKRSWRPGWCRGRRSPRPAPRTGSSRCLP